MYSRNLILIIYFCSACEYFYPNTEHFQIILNIFIFPTRSLQWHEFCFKYICVCFSRILVNFSLFIYLFLSKRIHAEEIQPNL